MATVGAVGVAVLALATPASAELVGYVPVPGTDDLTHCVGEKPWPVNITAHLDASTHVVHEAISFYRPNTPCAAYYYVHFVSITDSSAGLSNVRYVEGANTASQDVTYPLTRVGEVQFEVATGNQGEVDCQFWDYVANGETQPEEYMTSKGTGSTC
jgi:hypothetical protein